MMALVLSALFAIIAQALAELTFNRGRLFRQEHILLSERWVAETASRELVSCLWGTPAPPPLGSPPPTCTGWAAWTSPPGGGSWRTSRTYTYGAAGWDLAPKTVQVSAWFDGQGIKVVSTAP